MRDILAFSSHHQDITALNANIVAISADTEHCHYAFIERAFGGADVPIPLCKYSFDGGFQIFVHNLLTPFL